MSRRVLLLGGRVVDPANDVDALADVEIEDGRVAAVGPSLTGIGPAQIIDVTGRVVMPGVIDTHTHLSGPNGANGHRMMARVGVTTSLDLSGEAEDIVNGLATAGAGLNIAFVRPIVPRRTVSGPDPDAAELEHFILAACESGALGIKCLGGHYPITPGTLQRCIRLSARLGTYVAVHVGSTEHGSDIEGLEELLELAEGLPVHVAHVNSYCRGQVTGEPLEEVQRALKALRASPRARSESYLSTLNGTGGACEDGLPISHVTRTCLRLGGFEQTEAGLAAAIRAGWARVATTVGDETRLVTGEPAETLWRGAGTHTGLSFPVNPPAPAIALATAREPDGSFTIDAISTDGGSIPRNTTVEQGLALVRFGALTLGEFVRKVSTNGAAMLGCSTRGHLAPGAEADITVLDLEGGKAVLSLVAGVPVMVNGLPVAGGGTILTTAAGEASLRARSAGTGGAVRVELLA